MIDNPRNRKNSDITLLNRLERQFLNILIIGILPFSLVVVACLYTEHTQHLIFESGVILFLLTSGFLVIYDNWLMVYLTGQSLSHRLCGYKVFSTKSDSLKFWQIGVREISINLFEHWSWGIAFFASVILRKDKRAIHDLLSMTVTHRIRPPKRKYFYVITFIYLSFFLQFVFFTVSDINLIKPLIHRWESEGFYKTKFVGKFKENRCTGPFAIKQSNDIYCLSDLKSLELNNSLVSRPILTDSSVTSIYRFLSPLISNESIFENISKHKTYSIFNLYSNTIALLSRLHIVLDPSFLNSNVKFLSIENYDINILVKYDNDSCEIITQLNDTLKSFKLQKKYCDKNLYTMSKMFIPN